MEIRNRSTGDVITDNQLRADNPGTSFPKTLTAEVLDGLGYDPVLTGAGADISGPYQVSVRDGVQEIEGQWFSRFVAGPVFTNNDTQTAEEQETEYRARIDSDTAKKVRQDRNAKLAACDWTVMTDSPLSDTDKAAWTGYRQSLRNLPTSEGFPHTMEWPTEPT